MAIQPRIIPPAIGKLIAAVLCLVVLSAPPAAADEPLFAKQQYRIELDLDYRAATFTGRATVSFVNATRGELDGVNFSLYPNLGLAENEAPWLTVQRVKSLGRELRFSVRARGALVRVELPNKLLPNQSLELTLEFSAHIPRVQREETGLLAHFLQELSDAVSEERQTRDSRDTFFAADDALLLGYFFPLLTPNWMQPQEQNLVAGVSGLFLSEVADYEVQVNVEAGIVVIGSGVGGAAAIVSDPAKSARRTVTLRGEKLRGFALICGEQWEQAEKNVGSTRVVSYFRRSSAATGRRALEMAAQALAIFNTAFGAYPYRQLQVVELPLPAGSSGIEFPALVVLAQAYFIDFDAPPAARLPGIVREQAGVIKAALEFTLAHGVAHQWWGGAVGSDAQRAPYLDEALATYSAAYYHEAAHGAEVGRTVAEQQLRGTYQLHRLLGGADFELDRPAKDFRNALQYSAITQAKGALFLAALRRELGDEKFFHALRSYYQAYQFEIVRPEYLRFAFLAAAADPRPLKPLFQRWTKEKHGDEDIGLPEAASTNEPASKMRAIGRVLVKIGRAAARPF